MVLRTYVLMGNVPKATTNLLVDKMTVPSGLKRTIQEIRIYCSLPADTFIQLYYGNDPIYNFEAQVNDYYKLPYPGNLLLKPGDELRLVCTNRNATTDSYVKVEIVAEETTA